MALNSEHPFPYPIYPEGKTMSNTMQQIAPYPDELANLVNRTCYKKGWDFCLKETDRGQGSKGMTLIINIATRDAYHPEQTRYVAHYFPVPPASYDRRSWQRWLFDQILLVETHEAMEFFIVLSDKDNPHRPYAPSHGPGNDPYMIREIGTALDAATSYKGEVRVEPMVEQLKRAGEREKQ